MFKREEAKVKEVLRNLDKTDPNERFADKWDKEFKKICPILYRHDGALYFVDWYGYICNTFFENLRQEDFENLEFQRKMCRVQVNGVTGVWYCQYRLLLYYFLKHHDFDDVIKQELLEDQTKKVIIDVYNLMAKDYGRNPL